jgi:hypothetical protein
MFQGDLGIWALGERERGCDEWGIVYWALLIYGMKG